MAWMRQVCGRLESRYRYSNKLVYNNFPWPQSLTPEQKAAVEKAAQAVLEAREQFPGSTLADLYDPVAMPPALAKAHAELDRAVDRDYRKDPFASDRARPPHHSAAHRPPCAQHRGQGQHAHDRAPGHEAHRVQAGLRREAGDDAQ